MSSCCEHATACQNSVLRPSSLAPTKICKPGMTIPGGSATLLNQNTSSFPPPCANQTRPLSTMQCMQVAWELIPGEGVCTRNNGRIAGREGAPVLKEVKGSPHPGSHLLLALCRLLTARGHAPSVQQLHPAPTTAPFPAGVYFWITRRKPHHLLFPTTLSGTFLTLKLSYPTEHNSKHSCAQPFP